MKMAKLAVASVCLLLLMSMFSLADHSDDLLERIRNNDEENNVGIDNTVNTAVDVEQEDGGHFGSEVEDLLNNGEQTTDIEVQNDGIVAVDHEKEESELNSLLASIFGEEKEHNLAVDNDANVGVKVERENGNALGDLDNFFDNERDKTELDVDNDAEVAIKTRTRESDLEGIFDIFDDDDDETSIIVDNDANSLVDIEEKESDLDELDAVFDLLDDDEDHTKVDLDNKARTAIEKEGTGDDETLVEVDNDANSGVKVENEGGGEVEVGMDNEAEVAVNVENDDDSLDNLFDLVFGGDEETLVTVDNEANAAVHVQQEDENDLDDLVDTVLGGEESKTEVDVDNKARVGVNVEEDGSNGISGRRALPSEFREILASRGVDDDVINRLFGDHDTAEREPEHIVNVDNKANTAVNVENDGDGNTAVDVDNEAVVVVNIQERERRQLEDVFDRDFQRLNHMVQNLLENGGTLKDIFGSPQEDEFHRLLEEVYGEDLDSVFENDDAEELQLVLNILFREKRFAMQDILSDRLEDIFGRDQNIINVDNDINVAVNVQEEENDSSHDSHTAVEQIDQELSEDVEQTLKNEQMINQQ